MAGKHGIDGIDVYNALYLFFRSLWIKTGRSLLMFPVLLNNMFLVYSHLFTINQSTHPTLSAR